MWSLYIKIVHVTGRRGLLRLSKVFVHFQKTVGDLLDILLVYSDAISKFAMTNKGENTSLQTSVQTEKTVQNLHFKYPPSIFYINKTKNETNSYQYSFLFD